MQIATRKALTEQYDDDLDQWKAAILAKKTIASAPALSHVN